MGDLEKAFSSNREKMQAKDSKEVSNAAKSLIEQKMKFEEDRVELAKSDAKKAWKVAAGFGVVAILSIGAVIGLTPLKTVVPVMILVDSLTGQTKIIDSLEDSKAVSYGEILDKYWTKQFVIYYNSYDWKTVQSNYNAVELMSDKSVFTPYSKMMQGKKSPVEILGDTNSINIKVTSITFLPSSQEDNMVAQVSFVRDVVDGNGVTAQKYKPTSWEATLTFDYLTDITTEEERLINPLAYRVTSYREDIVSQ
ncbi:virB8 family protein [Vibrio tubiashii]|uniref:Conjugal transfer protein TraG n=1 Tax=Vibrio tubiashii ATCC 19109 TaxID=1051646 RepID=F9T6N3_9VIBR|nr:type IV secretion system protein [Vibrio tubiashii]AIW17509.1 conjugal transfer protein TraG [Vibrio tubiashii ATCC 19109]EGU54438.1 conjugal transfer protein TraG [Vibrio tubiashii ATCC 19109]EIF01280.1 conjugal transfer protein TraG [Vibrio tubiashii NCIMB 1337 = ATCC 19106]